MAVKNPMAVKKPHGSQVRVLQIDRGEYGRGAS